MGRILPLVLASSCAAGAMVKAEPVRNSEPVALAWISGANGASGFSQKSVTAWARLSGRPVKIASVSTTRKTWQTVTGLTWAEGSYRDPSLTLDIAQPMWPETVAGSLAACAGGEYDENWKNWGRTLLRVRNPVITRLGWEFNGDWWPWSAKDPESYKSCFRRIVAAVRSTAPAAVFEWSANGSRSQTCGGNSLSC